MLAWKKTKNSRAPDRSPIGIFQKSASLPLTRTCHKHESPTSVNYHRTGTKTAQDTAEDEARSLGVVEDGCSLADGGGDDNDDDDDVGAERNRASINMRIS
ncbi:unnamed protein product [Trichogramma brassicae]|uniref:Uncharacterized protein n=1 Tax=Trichogramma brassicae TaxID=86971 RepID=A0A6H5IPW3_9HYME|nr:unnamed protein product [Trichogramma brassicae]